MKQKLLIAMICSFFVGAEAKIIETRYAKDVMPLIDEGTWFLVDLDNCFFQAAQAYGHANWYYDELNSRIDKGMSRDEAIIDLYPLWMEAQKKGGVKPVEPEFIPYLIELQKRGVVVMALTHRQPGVAELTFGQVGSLGFDFRGTAPAKESFSVPAKIPGLYSQGILFVGDYNKKSEVFHPFLTRFDEPPKKIVFIDDKRHNVDDLEGLFDQGIEYIGVHYTAIEYVEPVY